MEFFAERLAHDFNNIITPILAYPDMLMPLLQDERCVKLVRAMQESAERALGLTQQLAALAGGGANAAEPFNMSAITSEAIAAVRQQLAGEVSIVLEDEIEPNCIISMQQEMYVRALEVVLENAIMALNSSLRHGTVKVVVEKRQVVARTGIRGERIPDGTYHVLSVRDSGCGMNEEECRYAVEPFVTGFVRAASCGAGLGLTVAYCGLRRNGAYMELESKPDEGTHVTMYFPLAAEATVAASEKSLPRFRPETQIRPDAALPAQEDCSEAVSAVPCPGRILLVDDEPTIVGLFKMILESFIPGIEVDTAENGAEALKRFKEHHHAVMVMDLHMPVMDGQSTYFAIEDYCREAGILMPSVVFCTGYAPQAHLRQAVEAQSRHMILNKPVQSDVLVRAVRERLVAVADT